MASRVHLLKDKKDKSLISSFGDMRIPFTEEGSELVAIHTKDVMDAAVVNSVQTVPKIREEPFKNFVRKERFVERSKRITDPLKKANPPKVITQSKKILSKDKDKVEILKGDRALFFRIA